MKFVPRGMYFEDFELGQEVQTGARTITEADIVNFAGISGDFNYFHINAEAAKETEFGQRIAHGMLVASIATGLAVQQGIIDGTALAFRELTWKFSKAVFIGDTIQVRITIADTKSLPKLGGGLVTMTVKVYNQHDDLVQRGEWTMLMRFRG